MKRSQAKAGSGKEYDVLIIGAGVTGTATLFMLSRYTNVKSVALVEKYRGVARLNSRKDGNSQTLHTGDIETNYTLEKARKVKAATDVTARYLEMHQEERIFKRTQKMVIAVGKREVEELEKRYAEFKSLYPALRRIGRKEIERLEPKVIEGRDPRIPIIALYNPQGYNVDFGRLAQSLLKHAKEGKAHIDIFFRSKAWTVKRDGELYAVRSGRKMLYAKTVVVATGADSLLFAHKLGYAKHWILLPVAGSFYIAPSVLRGKVYTMQAKKLPFAAVHGDPDVANHDETRFGPTAKVLPMTERYRYGSVLDFLRLFRFRYDATMSLIRIIKDPVLFKYILKNVLYDIPYIGTYFFLRNDVRKVVPSLTFSQISYGRRLGGIRPQLVDTTKRSLEFGDAKVIGEHIIFDITPSPGASVCLTNGEQNTRKLLEFLGKKYRFDEKRFRAEIGRSTDSIHI